MELGNARPIREMIDLGVTGLQGTMGLSSWPKVTTISDGQIIVTDEVE